MAAPLYVTDSGQLYHAGQILLAFVGLPARGKTHVSRSVERYLRWLGVKTQVFSLGDYRREQLGSSAELPKDYFSLGERSKETEELRKKVKEGLEDKVVAFFREKRGQVAIYDANNGARKTRRELRLRFEALGVNVFFIENICDRDDIVEANIRSVKISSPDYKDWDPDLAIQNYMARIAAHAKHYETMESSGGPYMKIFNVGERLVINNIRGYLQTRIVFYLMNVHHKKRTIWFARSGHSTIEHSYKADAGLSLDGIEYSEKLRDFIIEKRQEILDDRIKNGELDAHNRRLTIWTSARRRCLQTCKPFSELGYKVVERQQMYELNPGVIDGLNSEEIKTLYPDEWEKALENPFGHRYPRGESYHDLSVRLEPVILELEREPADVLLIGHGSVIRCLMSYLQGLSPQEIPNVELRRGDVVEVTPSAYGVNMTTHFFWQ